MNKIKNSTEHEKRVMQELIDAGMTRFGLMKFTTKDIPGLIHDDEHIGGVVYGLNGGGSATIIATNKRVIYMDHKPFFKKNDELSYDIVGGVSHNVQGRYAGIVLHTRAGDFALRYVNKNAAKHFVKFIESRQIERNLTAPQLSVSTSTFAVHEDHEPVHMSQRAQIFLVSHELGVLSTVDSNGRVHGAAVYYVADSNNYVYIVSKSKTAKISNISENSQTAFTIYDNNSMHTLQLSGKAHLEHDNTLKEKIFNDILRPRFDGKHTEMPPIMYLPAGKYVVICFLPTHYKFSDYKTR